MRSADPQLHQRRRTGIARAAANVFLAKGFHAASMADIARAADVSMGLLYRYFANKDALIAAAAELDRAMHLARIAALKENPAPVSALVDFVRMEISAGAGDSGYVPLVAEISAEACRNPAIARLLRADDAASRTALADVLAAHRDCGRLVATIDPAAVALLIFATIDGLGQRLFLDAELNLDQALETLQAMLEPLRAE